MSSHHDIKEILVIINFFFALTSSFNFFYTKNQFINYPLIVILK